ncbi:MAG: DNA cytosine methyltransferase [Eubacterium sp.]|nr:DNA cytosine methyltransferase [Eubacterium sp.]
MINTIDLFAGCGGLMEGFEKEGSYRTLSCVEWEKAPCINIINRLKTKWGHQNAEEEVLRFDIQRTQELFLGYDDIEYGKHKGLDELIGNNTVDVIIGGPPCQAYSLAGRIRDENGMRNDYRNYLFESYVKVVQHFKPRLFVFENVQGMLSAMPDGTPIVDKIKESFERIGYITIENFKDAIFNLPEYGVPQNRKRIIILGVSQKEYGDKANNIIQEFYNTIMPKYKVEKRMTVREAIFDLPRLYPLDKEYKEKGVKFSHSLCNDKHIYNHVPRYHNKRDIKIFQILAEDIESGRNKYRNTESLKQLYKKTTGKESNVHKYYVLRWNEQSNTIPAHLYKDGLRHIHPDSKQARTLTVREAARLQTFEDDYEFIGSRMNQYKMIGNAVPPKFSLILAKAVKEIFSNF